MSQKSSLPQNIQFVSEALMPDKMALTISRVVSATQFSGYFLFDRRVFSY
jgi:hypothetical protein